MAASDARPVCRKGVAWRLYFSLRTSAGALYTSWAAQDSEVSLDGAAFADCTNEATEIGTSGVGYLDLTASETNADAVCLKITTTGGLPYVVTIFPEEAGDYRADVTHISGDSTAADNLEAAADGTGYNLGGGSIVAASVTGAVGSVGAGVTVTTNNDKTGYSLSQSFPTNFASLAITAGGAVTAGMVSDKTGYSLSQSFPTNFASLAITGGGAVTAGTVSDKTGYSLATAPLDAAGVRAAVGLAAANLDTQLGTLATTAGIAALNGSQFTAIPWNAAWDAEVQSECTDALAAYDGPTKAEQDAAFTEIKGAGWASSTDTLEKIRDASGGGGGGTTVQINPIAISTGAPAEAPLMTCHQGEYGSKAYLFYDLDEYGQRSATDFSGYTDLRIGVALPDGTTWIETADITVSANQLTIPVGDLTNDVGTFEATLWDWAGAGATDQRLVVACMQLVVTEAVGADEVVA